MSVALIGDFLGGEIDTRLEKKIKIIICCLEPQPWLCGLHHSVHQWCKFHQNQIKTIGALRRNVMETSCHNVFLTVLSPIQKRPISKYHFFDVEAFSFYTRMLVNGDAIA